MESVLLDDFMIVALLMTCKEIAHNELFNKSIEQTTRLRLSFPLGSFVLWTLSMIATFYLAWLNLPGVGAGFLAALAWDIMNTPKSQR